MMRLRIILLLAMSFAVFIQVKAQSPFQLPSFTVHPQPDILAPGEQTTLSCSAPNTQSYSWLKDGVLIDGANSDSYVVTMDTNGDEAGEYSCLASNNVGTTTSRVANVQLAFITENFFSSSATSPHQVTVQEGVTAVISCGSYTSVPSAPLSWVIYDDSFPLLIDATTEKAVVGLDGNLYLQDPTSVNNEVFECRATNRDSEDTVGGFVEVTVSNDGATPSSPELLSGPQDVMVNEGDDAFFECIVGGRPLASVEWTYPNGANPVVRLEQNNAILRVRAVRPEDVGVYQCTASGVGTFTATLTITAPPVVSTSLPTSLVTVVYGSAISLQCGSSETGEWQWFYNGHRLADETGSMLEVASSVLENSGVYQCFITNSAGFDSSVALVEVETIPASITTPLPLTQLAFEEQPFQLTCAADGAPPPNYIWTKESVPLSSSASFDVSESGVLMILNVDSSSGGNYTCVASNAIAGEEVGSASTSTIVNTIAPTQLITEPGSLYKARLGTTDTLQCEVTYDQSAEVEFSWTKDGQELVIGGRISRISPTVGSIRLEAVEHDDAGVYVCTVATRYNGLEGPLVQSMPTNLTVNDSPIAPIIISVTTVSSTTLNVQWHFPSSSSVLDRYLIQYQNDPLGSWFLSGSQFASTTTARNITDLMPDTMYYVRIVAVYMYVSGSEPATTISDEVSGKTFADVPSGPPLEVRVMAVNNTAVRFEWEPPAQPNGEIVDYIIQYRLLREQNNVPFTNVSVGSGTARTYLLTGLQPLERYEFQIVAKTSAGLGPFPEAPQHVDTIAPITEPPPGPVYNQIWFIVVMVIVVLVVIVTVAIVILVALYSVRYSKSTQTYSVRPSNVFGNTEVVDEQGKNTDFTDDAFKAYSTRAKRGVELTMYNSNGVDTDTDMDSNFIDTQSLPYSTPQLSTSSRTNLVPPGPAPGYINPPTFEEAINRPRSQSIHSTHSRRSSMGEKPPIEYWEGESKSGLIDEPLSDLEDYQVDKRAMMNGGYNDYRQTSLRLDPFHTGPGHIEEYGYDYEDSDSMGKPSFSSEITDATEYSHLQAIGESGYSHLDATQITPNHATFV